MSSPFGAKTRPTPSSVFVFTSDSPSTIVLPSLSSFVAGGIAGAASRTCVSPLERLKILLQVQGVKSTHYNGGVWASLKVMWQEEGMRGMLRGNGINCLRIVPHSAVQFSTYELLKSVLSSGPENTIDTPRRLLAGAGAGIVAVGLTYPLDLIRCRLSIEGATLGTGIIKENRGIVGMTIKVFKEEGRIRGLYKGLTPTALGVAPYVGLNFAAYEAIKDAMSEREREPNAFENLLAGGLAGSVSQTLTYPLDLLRRRMQISGLSSLGYANVGSVATIIDIVRTEGVRGLYRGIWPNVLKAFPTLGVSFAVYEVVKDLMDARATKKDSGP